MPTQCAADDNSDDDESPPSPSCFKDAFQDDVLHGIGHFSEASPVPNYHADASKYGYGIPQELQPIQGSAEVESLGPALILPGWQAEPQQQPRNAQYGFQVTSSQGGRNDQHTAEHQHRHGQQGSSDGWQEHGAGDTRDESTSSFERTDMPYTSRRQRQNAVMPPLTRPSSSATQANDKQGSPARLDVLSGTSLSSAQSDQETKISSCAEKDSLPWSPVQVETQRLAAMLGKLPALQKQKTNALLSPAGYQSRDGDHTSLSPSIEVVAPEEPNTCVICPAHRSFQYPKDYRRHMLSHGDQGFFCSKCSQPSTRKDNNKRHEASCDGLKQWTASPDRPRKRSRLGSNASVSGLSVGSPVPSTSSIVSSPAMSRQGSAAGSYGISPRSPSLQVPMRRSTSQRNGQSHGAPGIGGPSYFSRTLTSSSPQTPLSGVATTPGSFSTQYKPATSLTDPIPGYSFRPYDTDHKMADEDEEPVSSVQQRR